MEQGDISNTAASRVVVIFDGFVGKPLAKQKLRAAQIWRATSQWNRLVACYDWDHLSVTQIRDMTWRHSLNVTLVSFLPKECEEALQRRADRMHLGVHVECHGTPEDFARSLAYAPEVKYVVHAPGMWTYTFGSRAVTSLEAVLR